MFTFQELLDELAEAIDDLEIESLLIIEYALAGDIVNCSDAGGRALGAIASVCRAIMRMYGAGFIEPGVFLPWLRELKARW